MKKFYLHNGTEQTGPFDINELRAKNIAKNSSIWYEGLSDWTTADKVEELNDVFKITTPPPFATKQSPPIIQKTSSSNQENSLKTNKNKNHLGLIIKVVVIVLLIGGGLIMITNNPNAIPSVKVEINTPKPKIVTSRADGKKSGLFNARTTVYATVINEGGDGNVLVTFYVSQGSEKYDKSKAIYLAAGQSEDLEMTFEEVDYISGKISYDVDANIQ